MATPNMPHALAVGEMIEEFRIIRILGAGGFGIVYECRNTHFPETAVIKEFLPPEFAYRGADGHVMPLSDQTEETFNWARDRFLQEAKTLWELARPERHPNIVRVTRYREANGTAYMFMDFEQGRPLSEILEQRGQLPPSELEALLYPLLDGLERVHAAAILHRDIKPANILIRADGTPVLIDFGAARRVVPGQEHSIVSSYTPVYAALEQYHNVGDQGPWTDIYSFGAVLYQAVTGHKPLSAMERLRGGNQRAATEECKDIYPQPILAAIDLALAVKPEERPRSVSEWRQSVATASDASQADEATVVRPASGPDDPTCVSPPKTAPTPAVPQATSEPAPQEPRRRSARLWLAAGTAVVVLMVSGLGLYFNAGEPDSGSGTPDVATTLPPLETAAKVADDTQPKDKPTQPPEPEPLPISGTRFSDPMSNGGFGPIMVWLPAGEFQMGSLPQEKGRHSDERRHLARVAEPFAMGETELTLGHYRRFIEETGYRSEAGSEFPCQKPDENWQRLVEDRKLTWEHPGYEVTDRHPVACVSWNDASAYANWLSKQTGRRYRLPTELEWEYAARAGTTSSRFWGDNPQAGCRYANTADCEDTHTYAAPAGAFPPNPFGLREMLGNLAEWTCSAYATGYDGSQATCSGRFGGAPQVLRGGSWLDAPVLARSAARDGAPRSFRFNTVGFRLVRTFGLESGSDNVGEPRSREAASRKVRR
ncbi:SUMF1/EgtB/PvdO family nonheme iron enzyme [Candidatus Thiosymbion oneisti]|uniref:SUMF1/EgtB/PvdO family nonheme iron enzyme n=1 Tax=Candidatus Thiosymbion oneisti TaxID=589554 RepID=UPI000A51DBD1|nr:SUMF1/EgtB/PvdO family nonheme iron enzyme [Candidatus Thiosymbion oneisti]